jgi:hypothetical protein
VGSNPAIPTTFSQTDCRIVAVFGSILPLATELLNVGDPNAERTVRETVAAGVTAFLDGQFLDPTVTLIANTRPASIPSGASAITSTGSTPRRLTQTSRPCSRQSRRRAADSRGS